MSALERFADRLMDVGDETGIQIPVEGLAVTALVTLSIALQVAVDAGVLSRDEMDIVEQAAYAFADGKLSDGLDEFALNRDEIAAIHSYTQESALYRVLNAKLRSPHRALLIPLFEYLKLLLTALYKLPLATGTFWRGIKLPVETLGGCAEGTQVIWWGLSSTTKNINVLTDDTFLGNSGSRTLFAVQTSSVVSIQPYSAVGEEEEYLALPGTVYTSAGVLNLERDLNIVHLKEDTTSPPLIDFHHPQIASRVQSVRIRGWNSIADAASSPNRPIPLKREPRCFLLHARSGCILTNHKLSLLCPGRSLQLHAMPNVREGHAPDRREVRFLRQGRFCWKCEVHRKGPDGLPNQACVRSDVHPQDCIAGDSDNHLRIGYYARRRVNREPQWVPQFMDDQTVTFKCRMNDLYLSAEERDGVWTPSLSGVPDAWVLLPAAGAFTPGDAGAIAAVTALSGIALPLGSTAAAAAGLIAFASKIPATVGFVTYAGLASVATGAGAVGAGVATYASRTHMGHSLWVDKTRH